MYTTASKIFRKIYFLYDIWCAQYFSFRDIFGLPMRNLTIAACAIIATWGKNYVDAIYAMFNIRDAMNNFIEEYYSE